MTPRIPGEIDRTDYRPTVREFTRDRTLFCHWDGHITVWRGPYYQTGRRVYRATRASFQRVRRMLVQS